MDDGTMWCWKHRKWELVVDSGSFTGFAGGTSYWWLLVCGNYAMDESEDLEACK